MTEQLRYGEAVVRQQVAFLLAQDAREMSQRSHLGIRQRMVGNSLSDGEENEVSRGDFGIGCRLGA